MSSFRVTAKDPLDFVQWGVLHPKPTIRREEGGLELILSTKEICVEIWSIAKTV